MTTPQEWEKKLDEKFTVVNQPEWIAANIPTVYLKSFIRNLRTKDREEVRKMLSEKADDFGEWGNIHAFADNLLQALDQKETNETNT